MELVTEFVGMFTNYLCGSLVIAYLFKYLLPYNISGPYIRCH